MTQQEIEDCLAHISQGAEQVRIQASRLTDRIKTFETFLSKMPGRCETEVVTDTFTLALRRDGSRVWTLLYLRQGMPAGVLAEAPLKIKLEGVRLFPDLLISMLESQEALVRQIEQACKEHDEYVKELKGA